MKKSFIPREGRSRKATAAASAVALVTAAGVLIGGLFSSPSDLMRRDDALQPDAAYVDMYYPDDDGDDGDQDDQDSEKNRKRSLRAIARERILRLPLAVRLTVILPLWLLGSGITALFSALAGASSPLMQGILGFVLQAILLLAGFLLAMKAVFPDLPLKKLLNRRTVPLLLLGAAALAAADAILSLGWPDYPNVRRAAISCGFLLLLGAGVVSAALRERKRRLLLPPKPEEIPAAPDRPTKLHCTDPGGDFILRQPIE